MKTIAARLLRRFRASSEVLEGYESQELVDVIFRKTIDYVPDRPWPEIAGAGSVLDFGGGCGLHYRQAQLPAARWAVVDTSAMVERAAELATCHLKFFASLTAAADWLGDIDVMHCNGALQYVPDPITTLNDLCGLRARRMMWRRLYLGAGTELQSSFLGDNGPGQIALAREKTVRYRRTAIDRGDFIRAHSDYRIDASGPDWFDFARRY